MTDDNSSKYDLLYHVTPTKNLKSIKRDGLKASCSKSSLEGIFFSNDLDTALGYCLMRPEEKHSVVLVHLADLDKKLLTPDNYELQDWLDDLGDDEREELGWPEKSSDLTWEQSLDFCGQVAYCGDVPAKSIDFSMANNRKALKEARMLTTPKGGCARK